MKGIGKSLALITLFLILFVGCQDGSTPFNPDTQQRANAALQNAEIGDYVWVDGNMDGIQGEDETGLGNVTVDLYNCEERLVASTTTDENGRYHFNELASGQYIVGFVAPDGYLFSPQDRGDNDQKDSDANVETGKTICFALGEDTQDTSRDAGLYLAQEEGCTYGKGFWKNHAGMGPQEDLVTDLLPLRLGNEGGEHSLNIDSALVAYNILGQHAYGEPSNGITKLYAHLLTAKLNIANGASDADIAEVVAAADSFLAEHDWSGWEDLSPEDRNMVNGWKDTLESYNEGEIGPGHCDENYSAIAVK